jgi:hypothetical protein
MTGEQGTLVVRCRFPTGKGNCVRVVIDEKTAGELDCQLSVRPGSHRVRVTSWGLSLCAANQVDCPPGAVVELALQVCFTGGALGAVIYLGVVVALAPLVVAPIKQKLGSELLAVVALVAAALSTCLLDFYVLLPAFSIYTFRLVEMGER